jgi:hypothetical protein
MAIDHTSEVGLCRVAREETRRLAGDDGWTREDISTMRAEKVPFLCHAFEYACVDLNIEHRLTKPRQPWTTHVIDKRFLDGAGYSLLAHG